MTKMQIKDLIELLKQYDENQLVVFKDLKTEVGFSYKIGEIISFVTKSQLNGLPLYGHVISEEQVLVIK